MAKAKEKKKKEPKVRLPNAWSSKKGGDGSGRGGGGGAKGLNTEGLWSAIITVIIILAIAFVFLGGVNQRKVIEWFFDFSSNIGEKFQEWFNPDNIDVTDDGVYYRPDGELTGFTNPDGTPVTEESEETTEYETSEDVAVETTE